MDKNWYSHKEIIEITGITNQTLNNWRRSGRIIYKKLSPKTFLYQFPEENNIQENGKKT